jgi:TctA family transporter
LERTMRQALVISHGSPMVFFTHPISLVFIILTVISILFVTVFMRK